MRTKIFVTACVLAVMVAGAAFAGSLDAPGGLPTDNGVGAMYTLESIYQRLATGAAGTKRSGPFAEPGAGPAPTGHTLDQVMGLTPAVDNTNGATAGDVLNNKTFWGLNTATGVWGLQTGTLACAATATGDATSADVLTGKTFSNSSANGITGTMTNNGAFGLLCGASNQTVTAGYCSGGTLVGDTNLVSANIRSGATIFGVSGNSNVVDTSSGTAAAGDILSGKTAFVNGADVTGSVPAGSNVTGAAGSLSMTIPDGLYSGSKTATASDTNLVAGNIVSGKTIFGVAGSASVAANPAPVPKTGQTGCWDAGGTSVSCSGTGQDGDKLKGVASPSPRFTEPSPADGTVKDNFTGLIWLKDANCAAVSPKTWTDALTSCNSLASGTCGLNDGSTAGQWRLPNLRELQSLIDYQNIGPALPAGHPFGASVQSGYYWSATTNAGFPPDAWSVNLSGGNVNGADKADALYVWPVR